jgi:hypothetical protein
MSSLGHTITNWKYLKFEHGPVPLDGDKVIEDLKREGFITELTVQIGPYPAKRMVFKQRSEEHVFSAEEASLLDMAIGIIGQMTAKTAKLMSHELPLYRWSDKDKLISEGLLKYPYLISERRLTGNAYESAFESAREQGLV